MNILALLTWDLNSQYNFQFCVQIILRGLIMNISAQTYAQQELTMCELCNTSYVQEVHCSEFI